ncbi:hypothetical protein TGRUB_270260 [Toxoplasma gondii RUB]|uniref:Uncharacterized protein n=4 Tax=Toxoplasma gondii TaxID=5811 RepID=V4ZWC1_TOXGV|nr:hypothetical protein TGVEG_270260 [Toxoplasma gondii VEG]KFG52208.1 hypothetical protein TGP89_270260 [Toxoplasma gondii p89]KFG61588.1 hypothetical protein TGRUB_270260 [Toxoplasma gondii RUB]PUA87858.1 hypothetical protein TGBR9_270260 [Toxoplasma gondii TgCATBr9]
MIDLRNEKHLRSCNIDGAMVTRDDYSVAMDEELADWDLDQQNKTDRLRGILDKIDRESYKSIQCLKSTLEAVDRRISTAGLSQQQRSARSKSEDLQGFTGSRLPRRFFYNRVADDSPSVKYPATSSTVPPIPAVDSKPLCDSLSISSPSSTSAQRVSRSRPRKKTGSRQKPTRSGVEDEPAEDQNAPVPGQLEGVFKGLRTLRVETQRLWTGLQQAREYANRCSTEASASSHSPPDNLKECRRDSARRTYIQLLDCIDSSSKLAERLECRINILEEKSRQKLTQIYNDLYIRQKFRLPPWPVTVKPAPTLLLRAQSGLQHGSAEAVEDNGDCSSRASVMPLIGSASYPRDAKPFESGDKISHPGSRVATREQLRDELLSACLVEDPRSRPKSLIYELRANRRSDSRLRATYNYPTHWTAYAHITEF